jgi:hypothetical protein
MKIKVERLVSDQVTIIFIELTDDDIENLINEQILGSEIISYGTKIFVSRKDDSK